MGVDWQKLFQITPFWAVEAARKGIERARSKGKKLLTVKCANTPTGVLHIGNANDLIRSYFIAKSAEMLGFRARVVFTPDDRDPARGFPPVICDMKGDIVEFPQDLRKEFEEKYNGVCVALIPDPFKCHTTWVEHFLSVYLAELDALGIREAIKFEVYSPHLLYFHGEWDKYVEKVLKEKEKVKEIYRGFKQHVREFAFSPICEKCGRIGTTRVLEYDEKGKRVKYVCGGRHLKKRTVEGCGYEGWTSIRNGKVDWYIEWALDWAYFDVDIEPFGKDHLGSSFRISPRFARELFGVQEPIPVPYEFFTVDGKKMSGSRGNLYNITEFLKMLEPEIILYFYTKRPMTQRDISLRNLNLLVDEWDALEARVFSTLEAIERGEIKEEELDKKEAAEKGYASSQELVIYYLCMHGKIPEKKPLRIPYNFAGVVGQVSKGAREIRKILMRTGHLPEDVGEKELERVVGRVRRAAYWARKYGPEFLRFEVKRPGKMKGKDREIVREIMGRLERLERWEIEEIQTAVHSVISSRADPREFYPRIYTALLGKRCGPKLGTLFSVLGREKTLELLKAMC